MQKKLRSEKRYRWTGKPRPGLPSSSGGNFPPVSGEDEHMFIESGKDCYKQSNPEQFKLSVSHNGCKSVRRVGNPIHALHSDCVVVCQRIKPYCVQPNGFTCQPLRGLVHASYARGIIQKKYLKKRLFGILFGILYMQATGQQRSLVNLWKIQVCSGRAETVFLSASGINFGAEYRMRRLICMVVQKMAKMSTKKQKKAVSVR